MTDIIGLMLEICMEVVKASHEGIVPPHFELEPHLHIKDMCDKLESLLSAMQEVCDAAVEHCNLPKCNCPLCTAIRKYKAIKE